MNGVGGNHQNRNNNNNPLLRLFIKISESETTEIVIWENNDRHLESQINQFCINNGINRESCD